MRKITILLVLLMLLGVGGAYAQFEDFENGDQQTVRNRGNGNGSGGHDRLIDRLRFGGDFGFGFSNNSFAVNVDPMVGYRFNQYVTAGVITTFEYYHYGDSYYYSAFSKCNFGGGAYLDVHPLNCIVLHAEAQYISYKDYYNNVNTPERRADVPILVGGGYHRELSDRAGINLMLLWNLNPTQGLENNTSFTNPIIRFSLYF